MKLLNFSIDNDNISLNYNRQYLDLHSNFDFIEYHYNELRKIAKFKWTQSHEDWSNEKICGFELLFKNVNYFKIRNRDDELPFTEDTCLNIIGFLSITMRDDFDSYRFNENVTESDDLNIIFMSNQTFKINSKSVEFCELNQEIIYIPLENKETQDWIPMWADRIDEMIYKIKYPPKNDPLDNLLKFKTNEIVICKKMKLLNGLQIVAIDRMTEKS